MAWDEKNNVDKKSQNGWCVEKIWKGNNLSKNVKKGMREDFHWHKDQYTRK